jgi:hypothetical protein
MMIETSPPDLQLQPLIAPRFDRNQSEPDSIGSVRALAKGVLRQAAKDLRAFHDAPEATGRECYRDAYSWVISNDLSWPYSFVNVCEALGLSAEFVRGELLADAVRLVFSFSIGRTQTLLLLQSLRDQTFPAGRSSWNAKAHLCGEIPAA